MNNTLILINALYWESYCVKTINTYNTKYSYDGIITVVIVIIACFLQHLIGNKVLACMIVFNNDMH